MGRNCLTCSKKVRLPNMPNENGGDFYRCTAMIIVPPFGMHYALSNVQRMVNVEMFRPDHPCHEWATKQDCPLHSPEARTK